MSIDKSIWQLLQPYSKSYLECDGQTRVFTHILNQHNIQFKTFYGSVFHKAKVLPWHYWLEVEGYKVDDALKCWFKNEKDVPNGVFIPTRDWRYEGIEIEPLTTSDKIVKILTDDKFNALFSENFYQKKYLSNV